MQTINTLQATRKKAIEKGGAELHVDIDNSNKVLAVSKGKAEWQAYVDYVNSIIVEGIARVVVRSSQYLRDQIDKEEVMDKELNPLLEVAMKLSNKAAVFDPPLGKAAGKGIFDLVISWLEGFINISLLVPRIDTVEEDGDYLIDMQEHPAVRLVTSQIGAHLTISMKDCEEFRQEFMRYEYLWQQDIREVFLKFLAGEDPPPNHDWDKFDAEQGQTEPTLEAFEKQIMKYKRLEEQVKDMPTSKIIGWLKVDAKQLKNSLATLISKWSYKYLEHLLETVQRETQEITSFVAEVDTKLDMEVHDELEPLLEVMDNLTKIRKREQETDSMFEPLRQTCTLLRKYGITIEEQVVANLESAPEKWNALKKKAVLTKEEHSQAQTQEANKVKVKSKDFEQRVLEFHANFKKTMPFQYIANYNEAYKTIDHMHHLPMSEDNPLGSISELLADCKRLNELQELFELYVIEYREAAQCLKETIMLKELYDMISLVIDTFTLWRQTKWDEIDVEFLGDQCKVLAKNVKGMNKNLKNWPAFKGLEDGVKNMQTSLPLVEELHHPAMRERHWKQLMRTCGVSFVMDDNFTFGGMLDLQLHKFEDDVMEIVDKAQKELTIEKQLSKISDTWKVQNLTFEPMADNPEMFLLKVEETVMECLEDSVVQMGNLQGSKYVQNNASFLEIVSGWQRKIGNVDSALSTWKEVQQKWNALQSIFIGSADIRVQLPEDSKRFDGIHADFGDLMKEASNITNAIEACNLEGRIERLEGMMEGLEVCEKALADYLETKRLAFPRFYFVAAADLLDILSKGSNPQLIVKHLPKCFDNIQSLEFKKNEDGSATKDALLMISSEGERVPFHAPFTCEGPVETWLFNLTIHSHECIKQWMYEAVQVYEDKPKHDFLFDWCAMVSGTCSRIAYMEEVNIAFDQMEEGNENAMREYNQKQVEGLTKFVQLVLGELTSNDRRKIVMIITVDVHARDVIEELIEVKAENNTHFTWMSQLKFVMDEKAHIVKIYICDYDCSFGYEYIGNCGCLVVTPLTDRCYITLTQAMRLILGGAPQGPAGTGKTETTKDLGRALGIMVYVFNCGDQMDYKACGQIFKGLSQAGAWGCFDEFNRINLDVLSVTSTQYKSVLDAIRKGGDKFVFEDEEIPICSTPYCCAFITMNPGYAGRNELPESVKALFRPCAMVTPDMDLIAEIMLMSEGYAAGKLLARKFMMLYRLSEALLSPQRHYDWKLRAVKTTLCVAGGLRRADMATDEDKVLLRALRDFNIGKLVAEDVNVFMGMLNDLFPRSLDLVPRRRDTDFELKIVEAAKALNLQCDVDALFTLKASQLRELLVVRWSVFVVGPAGSGKSEMERTLSKAQNLNGEKSTINYLNPKGVDRNELYGYMHPATREWKDGLISQIFRDLANCETVKHEWIVLDGDIDAEWIESMNTVMDDNKMLTLASNERIPLTPPMRLLLEVENMREASPATVSRGGVIFLNDTDVGWAPYIASWIQQREIEAEKQMLTKLFEDYGEKTFHHVNRNLKTIVPLPKINFAMSTAYILEGLLGNGEAFFQNMKQIGPEDGQRLFEMLFMYAIVWGAGGSLTSDKSGDYKTQFDKWFRAEFAKIPYPEDGLVFNYVVNQDTREFEHWSKRISPYIHVPGTVFGNLYVNSLATQELTAILDLVVPNRRPVCFVGVAGTGKTTIMKDTLRHIDPEQFMYLGINFNSFTTSYIAQMAIESVLEKKTGKTFGPPGSRKM
jgi:dynein heavy chain